MIALGKTVCLAGGVNCFVNDDVVTDSGCEYVVASDTGLSGGTGCICSGLVIESLDNLLFYGFSVASGAMPSFGKTGLGTGGGNCFIDNDVVTAHCYEHCITYGTGLCGCTGCRCACRVLAGGRNSASRYGSFNSTLCIGVKLTAFRASVIFLVTGSRAGRINGCCPCECVSTSNWGNRYFDKQGIAGILVS